LAWLNVLAMIIFLAPVAIGVPLTAISRPSFQAQLTPPPVTERLAEIESIADIERLRQLTVILQRSVDTDARVFAAMNHYSDQLLTLLVVTLLVAGAGFLANAALMLWVLRKQSAQANENAL
jgi:hypothetical protein